MISTILSIFSSILIFLFGLPGRALTSFVAAATLIFTIFTSSISSRVQAARRRLAPAALGRLPFGRPLLGAVALCLEKLNVIYFILSTCFASQRSHLRSLSAASVINLVISSISSISSLASSVGAQVLAGTLALPLVAGSVATFYFYFQEFKTLRDRYTAVNARAPRRFVARAAIPALQPARSALSSPGRKPKTSKSVSFEGDVEDPGTAVTVEDEDAKDPATPIADPVASFEEYKLDSHDLSPGSSSPSTASDLSLATDSGSEDDAVCVYIGKEECSSQDEPADGFSIKAVVASLAATAVEVASVEQGPTHQGAEPIPSSKDCEPLDSSEDLIPSLLHSPSTDSDASLPTDTKQDDDVTLIQTHGDSDDLLVPELDDLLDIDDMLEVAEEQEATLAKIGQASAPPDVSSPAPAVALAAAVVVQEAPSSKVDWREIEDEEISGLPSFADETVSSCSPAEVADPSKVDPAPHTSWFDDEGGDLDDLPTWADNNASSSSLLAAFPFPPTPPSPSPSPAHAHPVCQIVMTLAEARSEKEEEDARFMPLRDDLLHPCGYFGRAPSPAVLECEDREEYVVYEDVADLGEDDEAEEDDYEPCFISACAPSDFVTVTGPDGQDELALMTEKSWSGFRRVLNENNKLVLVQPFRVKVDGGSSRPTERRGSPLRFEC